LKSVRERHINCVIIRHIWTCVFFIESGSYVIISSKSNKGAFP
jgi:hypothetical protein